MKEKNLLAKLLKHRPTQWVVSLACVLAKRESWSQALLAEMSWKLRMGIATCHSAMLYFVKKA